jgi:hypothetical protein
MKTSIRSAALILALGLGLSSVATATDESMSRQRASEARNTNHVAPEGKSGWRHTVGTPFRYAGRAGMSVVRSPMILGETLMGERTLMSRDGFLVSKSEAKPEASPAENAAVSINMGRGQRIP